MYSKKYSHINKYFAFAVMVFAVLSGVSDNYTDARTTSSKSGNPAYFLNIKHLFIQSSGKLTTQVFINRFNAFNEYVQGIIAKDATDSFTSIATSVLFFAAIYLNNKILQNNLWRKAVF